VAMSTSNSVVDAMIEAFAAASLFTLLSQELHGKTQDCRRHCVHYFRCGARLASFGAHARAIHTALG